MTRRSDFRRVFSEGTRVNGPVTVMCRPCDEDTTHVAVIAGKRVGTAVRRNRAKRRMRAAMRTIDLPPGNDYVVIGSRAVLDAPFAQLCEMISSACRQAAGSESR